jgi:hypothetical protein
MRRIAFRDRRLDRHAEHRPAKVAADASAGAGPERMRTLLHCEYHSGQRSAWTSQAKTSAAGAAIAISRLE